MKKKLNITTNQMNIFISLIKTIIFPIIIISVALIILSIYNYTSSRNILENNASTLLSRIAKASDNKIEMLDNTTTMLKGNNILSSALCDSQADFNAETSRELSALKKTYPYLDNILILNQKTNKVCDINGSYNMEQYFSNRYVYQNYNANYWKDFKFYNSTSYRILSPTNITTDNRNKIVIPVIFRRTNDLLMNNLLVYNIDLQNYIDYSENTNSKIHLNIYLLNRYTNEVFSSDGTTLPDDYFPQAFYDRLLNKPNEIFDYKLSDGQKIVVSYSTKTTLTGYSYFSLIDKNTINNQLLPNLFFSSAIIFTFLIIAMILAFKTTKSISTPLTEIADMLSDNNAESSNKNIFEYMISQTHKLTTENNNLLQTLPCAQEKFLIDYLNATEYHIDENIRQIIEKTLQFPNKYFMILILQLSPTIQLFNKYTSLEYKHIQTGFYSIVKDLFSDKFPIFILPSEYESFYIIINLSEKNDIEKVNNIITEFTDLLKNDTEHIRLSIGQSKIYSGIEGLRKAHTEASDNLDIHLTNPSRIVLNAQYNNEFDLDCRDESDLFAALLSTNKQKVYMLLNIVFERNKLKSNKAQKHLYTSVMSIIFKVINLKQLALPDGKTTEQSIDEFTHFSLHDMKKTIIDTVDSVIDATKTEKSKTSDAKNTGQDIIAYIEENYTFQGMSIDYLASYFHMSTSGISTTIKNTIGLGFHEYLTSLRINKAKSLLLTTDESIAEISEKCGFTSQQTFYRSFKKVTGMTTSQIRASRQSDTTETQS